jgi:hypothetical protein
MQALNLGSLKGFHAFSRKSINNILLVLLCYLGSSDRAAGSGSVTFIIAGGLHLPLNASAFGQ